MTSASVMDANVAQHPLTFGVKRSVSTYCQMLVFANQSQLTTHLHTLMSRGTLNYATIVMRHAVLHIGDVNDAS